MRKMSEKRIITAALTGAMSPKAVNPNVPVTPEEIAEDAYKCYKAGAAIVHLHMRNAQDEACSDVELFRESQRLIILRSVSKFFSVPGLRLAYAIMNNETNMTIINMTTTGTNAANTAVCEEAYDERIAPVIELEPEMCSYDAASFNWMSAKPFTFQNPPAFLEKLNKACIEHHCKPEIEIFNPGMFGVIQWYTDRGPAPAISSMSWVCRAACRLCPKAFLSWRNTARKCSRTRLGRRSVLPKVICPVFSRRWLWAAGSAWAWRIPGFMPKGFWRTTRCWCSAQPAS